MSAADRSPLPAFTNSSYAMDCSPASLARVSYPVSREEAGRPLFNYRSATVDDAWQIGALHVRSWQETYTGLLPQRMLDGLSVENRAGMWASVIDGAAGWDGTRVYVAESAGEIVGFGACGSQRDHAMRERGFDGEIGAIYILRSHQGAGAGRSLMSLMARSLATRAMPGASLWVLRDNAGAGSFYESLGGVIVAEKSITEGSSVLHEVACAWPDVSRLI